MRRVRFAVFAALALAAAAGAAAIAVGVGPFARSAAGSVVYVAVSRSTDEADAREIEAIDLAAGTRELFDAGGRITAMVVSADRRSLYVAVDAGRITFLDATTGTRFAEVDLRGPTVTSLAVDPAGHTLYAVTATNVQSAVVPVDLDARKAGDPIALPVGAGTAVLRGDALIVPVASSGGIDVLFVSTSTRTVTDRLVLPRGSLAAPVGIGLTAAQSAVVGFEPSRSGGSLRVYLIQDPAHWQDVALTVPFAATIRGGVATVFGAGSSTGIVHICVPSVTTSAGLTPTQRRYTVTPDGKSAVAGGECGPMTGGPDILLARRDPAQLLVLDPLTGKNTRTLPLAGVPARLTR